MPGARRLHRWLGLVLGAWFLVLGVTGAILVYWHALEAMELPTPPPGAALPLQQLFESAARHMNEVPWRIFPPDATSRHARAVFLTDAGRETLYLEPATGSVQASLAWRGAAVHWLYDLHSTALAGPWGKLLVGLSGLPLLLGIALGLRLWLKRGAVPLREALLPRRGLRGRRLLSSIHRSVGFWALLPLLLVVASGLPVSFLDTTRKLLQPILPAVAEFTPDPAKGPGPVDLDGAVATALAALPAWRLAWAEPPGDGQDWLLVLLPRQGAWPSGRAAAFVNSRTGRLEEVRMPDGVDHARAWMRAFHEGRVFGTAHRLSVVAAGLAICVLSVLGLLLWRRGRRPARARAPA